MIISYTDTIPIRQSVEDPSTCCALVTFHHIYQHIWYNLTLTCFLPSPTSSEITHPPPIHHQIVTSSAINLLHLALNPSKAPPSRNSSLNTAQHKWRTHLKQLLIELEAKTNTQFTSTQTALAVVNTSVYCIPSPEEAICLICSLSGQYAHSAKTNWTHILITL